MEAYQSRIIGEKFKKVLSETLSSEHANDTKIAEFISHYLTEKDIKQAAKLSGLSRQDGVYLYNQPDIYKCIELLLASEIVKYGYNAAEVVERTKEIAFYDPAEVMREDGTYHKNLNDIPIETRRAIKRIVAKNTYMPDHNGVPQYTGEIITIEFHDKIKGLELIAREKDTFKKTVVQEHDIGKNARQYLLASAQRGTEAVKALGLPAKAVEVLDAEVVSETVGVSIPLPPSIPKPPGVL